MAETSSRSRALALAVLLAMQLMVILDGNVVALALPTIQADLGFSPTGLAWVVNAYLIAFGVLLLPAGRLGDLFGARRVFLIGLVIFTVASLACGLATSPFWLIAGRIVQGAGGAIASAVILGMIVNAYPGHAEQARAMGVFSFASASGAAIGLLGGGVITSTLGWHATFLVNVPIGVAALVLAPLVVPVMPGNRERRRVVIAHGRPAVSSYLTVILVYATGFGFQFMTALYLQKVLGYSAMDAGLAFLPAPVIIGVMSLILAPVLVGRFGARRVLVGGLFLALAGLLLLSRAPVDGVYLRDVFPVMLLAASGLGLVIPAVTMLAMAGAAPEDAGFASGLVNTLQQVGAAGGLFVLTGVAAARSGGSSGVAALRDGYMLAAAVAAGFVVLAVLASVWGRQAPAVEDAPADLDGHVGAADAAEQAPGARVSGEDQPVAGADVEPAGTAYGRVA